MPDLFKVATLAEQIAEVDREVAMRREVYPRRVRAGTMSQSAAERRIAVMLLVKETLEQLAADRMVRPVSEDESNSK